MRPVPILLACVTPATDDQAAQAHIWCQYCEAVHSHSAFPGYRVAHCIRKESLYKVTGYDLILWDTAASHVDALPEALFVGHRRLWSDVEDAAPQLRSSLLTSTLGVRAKHNFDKKIGRVRISVCGKAWRLEPDAFPSAAEFRLPQFRPRPAHEGQDLITLLSALYGVAPGVVGVRLLESVSGASLDAEARQAIAAEIDAAYSRKTADQDGLS